MRRRLIVIFAFVVCSSGFALNNRSAVSITGSDLAACTVPDPCRTFGVAIANTNPGGEIIVLSSGGYGAFTVNQAVSVIAHAGVHASISPSSGDAITINAAGTQVLLRGLTLTSLGAFNGVMVNTVSALNIEECNISGFSYGVQVYNPTSDYKVYVSNTNIRNNFPLGFYAFAGSFSGKVSIDHCQITGNGTGVTNTGGVTTALSHSVISGSSIYGVRAYANVTNIESCQISNGNIGVIAGYGGGTVRISNSVITANSVGVDVDTTTGGNGTIQTRQNNTLINNVTNISAAASTRISSFAPW